VPVEIARECCFANGFLSNGVLIRPGQLIRYTGEEIVPFCLRVAIYLPAGIPRGFALEMNGGESNFSEA